MLPASLCFKHPLEVWRAYFGRRQPRANLVDFRDGGRAWLSSNPHDIISLVINFCRREYGPVPEGATVVDIGANIGMYALHACRSGASELIAVEPVPEAAEVLSRNLEPFRPNARIRIINMAASSTQHAQVYMPRTSSPYARAQKELSAAGPDAIPVKTVTLDALISSCSSDRITILKLDCEGAEWDILTDCSDETLARVESIRMELHSKEGKDNETLLDRLRETGFEVTAHKHMIYWLDRTA
jgi:FkbM family methyltransferase